LSVGGGPSSVGAGPTSAPAVTAKPRGVVLVANEAAPYSRGQRVARSLAGAGIDVEIAAVAAPGLPAEERGDGFVLRRYRPTGTWARFATDRPRPGGLARGPDLAARAVGWPANARGWWDALRRELPPADLYHACGILSVGAAIGLAETARRSGRAGRVVYDVIDVILESNNYDRVPGPLLAWYRRRERAWVRAADGIVTVNEPIARHLARSWGLARPPVVLLNGQPERLIPADDAPRPDHIRAAADLPADRRVVLFLGRLGRERGIDEAAQAILRVDGSALAFIGFGPWADRLRERDRDPRFAGRHVTLPPVPPDDVVAWAASADASLIAVPANSLNQRLSTPNKFWESLAAGTPVVLGRGLEVMRDIVETDDLGAVVDPADPDDIARGLREVLDRPAGERLAMRRRCLRVSRDRFSWEATVADYLRLVEGLLAGRAAAGRPGVA
jgi:glycosyltransferase involved in cell wall biosynthesis